MASLSNDWRVTMKWFTFSKPAPKLWPSANPEMRRQRHLVQLEQMLKEAFYGALTPEIWELIAAYDSIPNASVSVTIHLPKEGNT